jgi:hypothetical protein
MLLQILILFTSTHLGFSVKCQSEAKSLNSPIASIRLPDFVSMQGRYHAPTGQLETVCMTKISGILLQYKKDDTHITIAVSNDTKKDRNTGWNS